MTVDDDEDYTVFLSGEMSGAGTMAMPANLRERGIPSHWSVYFQVDDVDAAVEKAVTNGGRVGLPPTDIATVGRIAFLMDPQGAGFGLTAPESP